MPDRVALYARQRRLFALLMSASWVVYGCAVILTYQDTVDVLSWIPGANTAPHVVGMGFVLMGVISAILAYESQERRSLEGWCYGLLTAGPLLMGVLSVMSWFLGYSEIGFASGIRFLMFAGIAFFMAGLRPSNVSVVQKEAADRAD